MKNAKKWLAFLLAVCCAAMLAGCSISIGTADTEEETDSRQYAQPCTVGVALPEEMDSTARFATQQVANESETALYVVFNGIRTKNTGYFTAPDGTLTFTCSATGESPSLKYLKIAVWQKGEGTTQYVADTTYYVTLDGGNYNYTITGLDPAQQYRLTISYDSYRYYIYGTLRVEGAAA